MTTVIATLSQSKWSSFMPERVELFPSYIHFQTRGKSGTVSIPLDQIASVSVSGVWKGAFVVETTGGRCYQLGHIKAAKAHAFAEQVNAARFGSVPA